MTTPGRQAIRLADINVKLQTGQVYRWEVELTDGIGQSSDGDTVSAVICRVPLPPPPPDVGGLASKGYWYDALEQLIEEKSGRVDDLLRQQDIKRF